MADALGFGFVDLTGATRVTGIELLLFTAGQFYNQIKKGTTALMRAREEIEVALDDDDDEELPDHLAALMRERLASIWPVEAVTEGMYEWEHRDEQASDRDRGSSTDGQHQEAPTAWRARYRDETGRSTPATSSQGRCSAVA